MKLYIDSAKTGTDAYETDPCDTKLEIYSKGKSVKEGVLQCGQLSVIDLGQEYPDELQLVFTVIKRTEEQCIIFEHCNYSDIKELEQKSVYEGFTYNTELKEWETGQEYANLPRRWIYAYDTRIKLTCNETNPVILFFSDDFIEEIAVCKAANDSIETEHVRVIGESQLFNDLIKWIMKWAIKTTCFLVISTGVYLLALILIGRTNSDFVRTQGYMYGIVTVFFWILPNYANVKDLFDKLKVYRKLKSTKRLKY